MPKIKSRNWQVRFIPLNSPLATDTQLIAWLTEQAQRYALVTLLAHALDGVIWGQWREDGLKLSSAAFPHISPQLRVISLQECRLFSPQAELYLWRDQDEQWQARLIEDGQGQAGATLDEQHILWGTQADDEQDGFTLLSDGSQGNRHAPPLLEADIQFDPAHNHRPVRLKVRHYVANDTDEQTPNNTLDPEFQVGLSYIALSRLVALKTKAAPPVREEETA